MLQMILMMALTPATQSAVAFEKKTESHPPIAVMTAAVKPCNWPNRCGGSDTILG